MILLLKLLQEEKGSAIIIVVICLTVFMGIVATVTDAGAMYLTRSRLQTAADSAALAGVQNLPGNPSLAVEKANYYALSNSPPDSMIDTPQVLESNRAIYVSAHKTVNFGFARAIGHEAGSVSAEAMARLEAITGVRGALSVGVMQDVWTLGDEVVLKGGGNDKVDGGWRGALALGGSGSNVYEKNLKYGYDGIIRIKELIDVEDGNMSGPTRTGTEFRITACPHTPECTIDKYTLGCPRIGLVPILEPVLLIDKKGEDQKVSNKQVRIVGFALFLISDVPGNGNDSQITGRFIQGVVAGESNPDGEDFGLYKAKLVQ
jgi:Flp pilus assembly protein TadG